MAEELSSAVIDWFHTRIDTITTETRTFRRSGYRFTPAEEPDSAIDGLYYVAMDGIEAHVRGYGTTENRWVGLFSVDVGYFRGGGDMNSGDRKSINRDGADDAMVIADIIEDPASYDGANTGIRTVTFAGATRITQDVARDVWRVQFRVEWRSDWRAA